MSETVAHDANQNAEDAQASQAVFEPITSQDQLDKLITSRLAREKSKYADYEDLKTKAAKLDEIEAANKSELQKAQDALAAETKARTGAEIALLRLQIAAEQGLDVKAASFLHGANREELEVSAAELTALIGAKPRIQPDPTQGRESKPGSASNVDWLREAINRNSN